VLQQQRQQLLQQQRQQLLQHMAQQKNPEQHEE
jgi:hypothetical protein